ncbi:MAG: type III secretion T3S chaperone [Rhabdochlamydiaceae bacterium]|jgi:flagellar biosynthesis chaperone FliJ
MEESSLNYPLEQITVIKQKKLDEAEKVLREKKKALEREQEKLISVEKERNEVKDHRFAKLTQLREKMDEGAPSDKIQQMRYYLKVVDEKLKAKELKVKEQQKVVEAAKQQVEIARTDLIKKQQDVEKMATHRKEWEKEMKAVAEQKEGVETDEMGAVLHQRRRVDAKKSSHHPSRKKRDS